MGVDYSENLKRALVKHLPALKCRVEPNDISVKEKPDGDYAVEINVRTNRLQSPEGISVDYGPVVRETYTTDEALETEGSAYREKTKRLAQEIQRLLAGRS